MQAKVPRKHHPYVSKYLSFIFFTSILTTHLIQNKIYNYCVF
jgi:hypothetical protein